VAPGHPSGTTAAQIRQVALDLFARNGYDATSMREIAGAVGIRAASLYNHFGSKGDILWDLTLSALKSLEQERAAAARRLPAAAGPARRLEVFVGVHVAFHATHSREAVIVNHHMEALDPKRYRRAVALRDAHEQHLSDIVTDGVERGVFNVPDLRVTTFAILQMATGVSAWYRPGGPLAVEQLCRVYQDLALRMVGRRRAPRRDPVVA
jgi:AcrR family transcriptional regulator